MWGNRVIPRAWEEEGMPVLGDFECYYDAPFPATRLHPPTPKTHIQKNHPF